MALRATFPSHHTHAHMAQVVTSVQSSVPLELKDCLSCSSRHICANDKLQASSNNWIFLFHAVGAHNIFLASFVFFLSAELRGFSRPLFSSKVDLNSVNLNRFVEFPDHRYPRPFFFQQSFVSCFLSGMVCCPRFFQVPAHFSSTITCCYMMMMIIIIIVSATLQSSSHSRLTQVVWVNCVDAQTARKSPTSQQCAGCPAE